jgi:hypothetical protein
MSFFKKMQEKASVIGSIAKEYYDEGVTIATKDLEKEKGDENGDAAKGKISYSFIPPS